MALLFANGKLSRCVSVLYPPIPQWVPYVAGGETPTKLKSAKKLNQYQPQQNFISGRLKDKMSMVNKLLIFLSTTSVIFMNNLGKELAWILVNPAESHPEQRGHGSSRESRGERCEDRKGFSRWGESLSFVGTYQCPGLKLLKV